jgi:histidinol-phosphate aminotransferase
MSKEESTSLFRSAVAGIPPYNAGLSPAFVRTRYGVTNVVKLASNENPLGASPVVADAIAAEIAAVARYPDAHCLTLRETIAATLGVAADRLVFGNGSEDLIAIAGRAFLDPGDTVVLSSPTFSVYGDTAAVMGAHGIDVPRRADLTVDVDAVLGALDPATKLLCLCNPNNPTGTMIGRTEFERLCRGAGPHTLIIVDEAYYEYARGIAGYPDSLSFLPEVSARWLVLRTFSKAYGLAGLRVGYGIASDAKVAHQLQSVRSAFNVNHLAQTAAIAAWSDQDHVARSVAHNAAEIARVDGALRRRGYRPARSATNFLFFDVRRPARDFAERLLAQGVIVKSWGGAFASFLRVSIGTAEENDRFLEAFDKVAST